MLDSILAFFKGLPNELYVLVISALPIIELRGAVPIGTALGLPFYINYPLSVIGNMLPIPFILLFIPKILDFLAKFKLFRPMVLWLRKKADKHSGKIIKSAECGAQSAECRTQSDELRVQSAECRTQNEECRTQNTEHQTQNTEHKTQNSECRPQNSSLPCVKGGGPRSGGGIDGRAQSENCEAQSTERGAEPALRRRMSAGVFVGLMLFVALPLPGTGAWTGSLVAALFDLPKAWSLLAIFLGVIVCGIIMCLASYGVLGFLSFLL